MDVLETDRKLKTIDEKVANGVPEAGILMAETCPSCRSVKTKLVWCGWTTRISRCDQCGHEWISHRMEFADSCPMIS